jgi:hypothetical protein
MAASAEIDFAVHHMVKAGAARGQHHLDLELALAAQVFLAHHALDLLLGGDANLLQEFPHRHVEFVLVHPWSPWVLFLPDLQRRCSHIREIPI